MHAQPLGGPLDAHLAKLLALGLVAALPVQGLALHAAVAHALASRAVVELELAGFFLATPGRAATQDHVPYERIRALHTVESK